jgi:hypothetical protein
VIRFGLSGSDWATPTFAQLETIRDIASHELAHLWNAGVYSSEARLSPWLHEGNAELLSHAAQYQLGYKDLETLRKNAERAIRSCLQSAGDQPWPMNPERLRGRIPLRLWICNSARRGRGRKSMCARNKHHGVLERTLGKIPEI